MNSKALIKALVISVGFGYIASLTQGCTAGVVAGAAAGGALIAYDRRTTGTIVDDQAIELKARAALDGDEDLSGQSNVSVTSYNGNVLLTGETPSETLREKAESKVRTIDKVRQIHNEVIIAAPSAGLSRSGDSWITSKVKTNLLREKSIEAARIKVVTDKGTVYLMGLVSRNEADAATEIARRVSGVQRVVKLFEYTG